MSLIQALFIAILQGATELFPVSSLGHAVLVPALLHMNINSHDEIFLPFLVMLHFGTAFALLVFFWRDWHALGRGVLGKDGNRRRQESLYILYLLVLATLPAIILGGLAEKWIRSLFSTPDMVSIFLIINGFILIFGEKMRRKRYASQKENEGIAIAELQPKDALIIGLWQCAAFFPGISRSGGTIIGGLLRNLSYENAARFSFLMALPVILAASAHQSWKIYKLHIPWEHVEISIIASIVACIVALISTAFLMRYFKDHEKWALTPFGFYCIALGVVGYFFLTGM